LTGAVVDLMTGSLLTALCIVLTTTKAAVIGTLRQYNTGGIVS